jgi:hypothetical protein
MVWNDGRGGGVRGDGDLVGVGSFEVCARGEEEGELVVSVMMRDDRG